MLLDYAIVQPCLGLAVIQNLARSRVVKKKGDVQTEVLDLDGVVVATLVWTEAEPNRRLIEWAITYSPPVAWKIEIFLRVLKNQVVTEIIIIVPNDENGTIVQFAEEQGMGWSWGGLSSEYSKLHLFR